MIRKTTSFFILALFAITLIAPAASHAAISNWQKGVTILPRWDADFESHSFRQSIDNLMGTNVNYVTLVVPIYQSNIWSTDIHRGWNTPTDAALASAVDYIHGKGLRVSLVFHLDTYDGHWRAMINPDDRGGWFTNYGNLVRHFATLGENHGVEQLVIGSELISMAADNVNGTNTENWRELIQSLRTAYHGVMTYSANWGPSGFVDEKNSIAFWDALDAIGISAYFSLETDNSVNSLKGAWDYWNNNHIRPLSQRHGKPVLFTEVGYRSANDAHRDPWNSSRSGSSDEITQANAYEALFSYWNDQPFMIGMQLWNWESDPNAGWPGSTSYTPQHKQAEGVMRQWFAGGTPTTPPVTDTSTAASFSATGSGPSQVSEGQPATITANVQNSGSTATGTIVDLEVYNPSGAKVLQQFFDNQSFSQNQSRDYSATWTPNQTGDHILKIGAFASNWTTNYTWNDRAAVMNVTDSSPRSPTSTPPSSESSIDIWWPTDGVHAGGTQPLKALVKNWPVSDYNMFWQVDGDRMNPTYDSFESWQHKEAWVDLSNWNWKGEGPYQLNFRAETHVGTIIGQRAINIFVDH
ncbi:MAG: hypothetical protein HY471_02195 [Candidatus Sungbacteria bacterium]|nr:hypothetical protein [Candidatus Sungbacteria bacterium]